MAGLPVETMLDRPIPGESLTTDPNNPMPYERPPMFTNYEKAVEHLTDTMLESERAEQLADIIAQEMPVDMLAVQIVFGGMTSGKWNPDLMLLLIEPVIYILLFIAEHSGLDYSFYFDDDKGDPEGNMNAKRAMLKFAKKAAKEVEEGGLEQKMASLLGKVEEMPTLQGMASPEAMNYE